MARHSPALYLGDKLERPLEPEHMQSKSQGILTFAGHAEGQTVGDAAVLTNDVGKASQTTHYLM